MDDDLYLILLGWQAWDFRMSTRQVQREIERLFKLLDTEDTYDLGGEG